VRELIFRVTYCDHEPNLKYVYLIEPINEEDPSDPIKLLEVVEGTIERGIEPIAFVSDPARGIEYPSLIIEVSPNEFEAIRNGQLGFGNQGWILGTELTAN
jgi:hypothetical protein